MGEVFAGRFELLDPIAEGGMGSVWRVRDRRDGQAYAAKLLRQTDASSLLRFMREQATRIHHPHVVTPVSWAGEDDRILFTMPLVGGGSVHTVARAHGPLPEPWVAAVLDQVLDALTAVHAVGVVHRDVKPANILLEPTGAGRPYARLTDFGIAVPLDQPRLTQVRSAIGTPGYMPPEQEQGADPDPRQDLYAVGVVGLEMLAGRKPPFPGDTLRATPLVQVLQRAAEPDPALRPASAAELRNWIADAVAPPQHWESLGVQVADVLGADAVPTAREWSPGGTRLPTGRPRPDEAPTVAPGGPLGPPPTAQAGRAGQAGAATTGLRLPAALAAAGVLLLVAALLVLLTG